MVDFSKLADTKLAEVEAPRPIPVGTYIGHIDGVPKFGEARFKDKETGEAPPVITVTYALLEAQDDVDAEELDESGGLRLDNGKSRTITQDFICNGGKIPFRFKKFLESFEVDENSSIAEACESIAGESVIVSVSHRSGDDGTQYHQVKKAFANK